MIIICLSIGGHAAAAQIGRVCRSCQNPRQTAAGSWQTSEQGGTLKHVKQTGWDSKGSRY